MRELEDSGLPIVPRLPEIAELLRRRGALVLSAEPGAGKTSLVPLHLAFEAALPGKILVLEPRRVAAVSAAWRMAELLGEEPGGRVGYRVRGESRIGRATRVEAVTEGVLLRMIQSDPGLEGVGALVFDEFHERSLQADLGLALARESRVLRPDLRLLVMSATLDTERIAAALDAPRLEVEGRSHPVEIAYRAVPRGRGFEEALAGLALELLDARPGDLLAFLPGRAEIARTAAALAARAGDRVAAGLLEILPLHGSLSLAEQRRVVAPRPGGPRREAAPLVAAPRAAPRRIVLATSIAETSLTVPGVGLVLDSGLARLSRIHPRSGLNRLVTETEAKDRAAQRAGRAGRLGPGFCLRAWSAAESLAERTEPEILRAELSGLVLEAAAWGCRDRLGLPWLDAPPEGAWEAGREILRLLGALDGSGAATERGRAMAALGTEPRLAALVLEGAARGALEEACLAAALLSEGGSGELPERLEAARRGDPAYAGARLEARRLESLAAGRRAAAGPSGAAPTGGRAAAAAAAAGDQAAGRRRGAGPEGAAPSAAADGLAAALAAAFPDRVARRVEARGPSSLVALPSGRRLRAEGSLAAAEWLLALDADAGEAEGRLYAGLAVDEGLALEALAPTILEAVELEWRDLGYRARIVRRAGAILLAERAAGRVPRAELEAAFLERLRREGPDFLPWGGGRGSPRAFFDRLTRIGAAPGAAELGGLLLPFLGPGPEPVLDEAGLLAALRASLDRAAAARLERECPAELALPSGRRVPIDYGAPGGPRAASRIQDFFGLGEQPRVGGEPLVLVLLNPAGRPAQVTADLPGFWRGGWAELRKELRGRYPKHDWPEDPATARPPAGPAGASRRRQR